MFKTLTAALVAAGIAIAPIASQAAQPAAKTVTVTKVVKLNGHKRHAARHHARIKTVKHVRGHKVMVIKKTRHGQIKAHKRSHVVVKNVKLRAN